MPKEVATEMLCAPKARLTNRERKECCRARETRYESEQAPLPAQVKLKRRFSFASFKQLRNWFLRSRKARVSLQRAFQSANLKLRQLQAIANPNGAQQLSIQILQRSIRSLDEAAERFDLVVDLTEAELKRRGCLLRVWPFVSRERSAAGPASCG